MCLFVSTEGGDITVNVWLLLFLMLLTLGLFAGLWVMVQFALISDDTREAIYGKEIPGEDANPSSNQDRT